MPPSDTFRREPDPDVTVRRPGFDRRAALALSLALAAVVAATLAARGPAIAERASFSWPPSALPADTPSRGWYAPLLLARHEAERIDARIPCGEGTTVPEAGSSVLVFATTRDPGSHRGLAVTRSQEGGATAVHVGRETIATIAASENDDCTFGITVDGDTWRMTQPGSPPLTGTVVSPPAVSGFFTELDLRADPGLRVDVRPYVQDTRPTTTQTVLRLLTVVLLLAAIAVLVPSTLRWRPVRRPTFPKLAAQDAVVMLAIVVWWLLAPLHFDDGWVRARELNSLVSGGFSNYYEYEGANLPLATWFEWLQHFLVARTSSLALHRLPMVFFLTAAWLVCRWCLARLIGRVPDRNDTSWWAGTLAFCVGVVAFGMTLRAEPAIALFVVGVLACCLRYTVKPGLGVLVVAVLLSGLAVTAHPAGVIAVAPLVLCLPRMWRDARNRAQLTPIGLIAVLPIGLAWALLLAFLDSDLTRRNENISLITASGNAHSSGVVHEYERYQFLNDWGASPVRREFVALLFVAVGALAVDRLSRRRTLTELLPSASIALGLLFLAVTPSKWLWHFGGFVGLAAVAIGFETHRLATRGLGRRAAIVVIAVVGLLPLAVSIDPKRWGPLDVGGPSGYQLTLLVAGTTLGALAVVLGLGRLKRVGRPELVTLPAVCAGLLAVTVLSLAGSAAADSTWSVPRQITSNIAGRDRSCGIVDDLAVPTPESIHPLHVLGGPSGTRDELVARRPGLFDLGKGTHAWYRLPAQTIGVFVDGEWGPVGELTVDWGRSSAGGVERLSSMVMTLPKAPGRNRRRDWTLVPESSFPRRPPLADAVRIRPRRTETGQPIVSPPVSFAEASVGSLIRSGRAHPGLDPMVFEAAPCASLPRLAYGLAEPPSLLVEWLWGPSFGNRTSPFLGLDNVYATFGVPVTRNHRTDDEITAFWVLPAPGEALVQPTRRVWLE